jgi:hypothetical protein
MFAFEGFSIAKGKTSVAEGLMIAVAVLKFLISFFLDG